MGARYRRCSLEAHERTVVRRDTVLGIRQAACRLGLCSVVIAFLGLSWGCGELVSLGGRALQPHPPSATPSPISTPLPPVSSSPTPSSPAERTLTLWVASEFVPAAEILTTQLKRFEIAAPDLRVRVKLKGTQGKGGLVNLLAAAVPVAPTILPDLAIVNADQARTLAQLGLIYPWDMLPSFSREGDMFPLAEGLGYRNAQRMGIPLALDVQHLVYDVNEVLSPPSSWREILTGRALYLFPGKDEGDALDVFLIQYIMAGGRLFDESGAPLLEKEPLATALARYQGLRIAGVTPPATLQLDSLSACWPLYMAGQADIVHVWASNYLAGRSRLPDSSFAPIPSADETRMTIGRGWLMVLVTKDPARQEAAARFLNWWQCPEHSATLCQVTNWLPSDRSAFALWQGEDEYYGFLREQLQVARPQPDLPSPWAKALSEAIRQVLQGQATAQEATEHVMAIVNP